MQLEKTANHILVLCGEQFDDEADAAMLALREMIPHECAEVVNCWYSGGSVNAALNLKGQIGKVREIINGHDILIHDDWAHAAGGRLRAVELRSNEHGYSTECTFDEASLRLAIGALSGKAAQNRLAMFLGAMCWGGQTEEFHIIGYNDQEDDFTPVSWSDTCECKAWNIDAVLGSWASKPLRAEDFLPENSLVVTVSFKALLTDNMTYATINLETVPTRWTMPRAALPDGFDPANVDHLDALPSNPFTPADVEAACKLLAYDFAVSPLNAA